MELEAWSGDWGLPSIDSECLKILAFAKFSGAPLTQVLREVVKLTLLKRTVMLMRRPPRSSSMLQRGRPSCSPIQKLVHDTLPKAKPTEKKGKVNPL